MTTAASISPFIKEIGRGKAGARNLTRSQAREMFELILDGAVSDLEIGAFCIAMRVKGESTDEMLGFLDALGPRIKTPLELQNRLTLFRNWVVLPSYNGARKLPVLTPLLAGLLHAKGIGVLVHGQDTETRSGVNRVTSAQVFAALGWANDSAHPTSCAASPLYLSTQTLCPGLDRLLKVRRTIGVRNSAHSLVKLINPLAHISASSLLVTSYTHPEYLQLMGEVQRQLAYASMLLRGTEGEPVADARRGPRIDFYCQGVVQCLSEGQSGSLAMLPQLPSDIAAPSTAQYIQSVLQGEQLVPEPISTQVEHILHCFEQMKTVSSKR